MRVATVAPDNLPDARLILLKGFDTNGFTFVTNYQSHIGQQLDYCPHSALVFCWAKLERQVRVRGKIHKASKEQNDNFWNERPRGALLAVLSSN